MGTSSTSSLSSEISMDNFLTLFVTQLQNQNPLDPTDNSEFMSQLAQFSALEQEQQQTGYLSNMSSMEAASLQLDQISMASTFIGKTITYSSDGKADSNETQTGVVEGVKLEKDGTVSFIIQGESVSISNLIEVSETSTAKTSTSSTIQSKSIDKK
ncbi:MAG: flagellar hook assembly protein FlgD [Candidatus Brocadia sp.]